MSRLEAYRKNAKLTQEELADLVGVTKGAVSKWETEGHIPRPATLRKLADLFGCRMGDLLEEEG